MRSLRFIYNLRAENQALNSQGEVWAMTFLCKFFPGGSVVKNLPANAGDVDSIPGWERFLGKGNGNPLQHSCLGNPMDSGAWQAIAHGVTKNLRLRTKQQLFSGGPWWCDLEMVRTKGI